MTLYCVADRCAQRKRDTYQVHVVAELGAIHSRLRFPRWQECLDCLLKRKTIFIHNGAVDEVLFDRYRLLCQEPSMFTALADLAFFAPVQIKKSRCEQINRAVDLVWRAAEEQWPALLYAGDKRNDEVRNELPHGIERITHPRQPRGLTVRKPTLAGVG